MTILTGPEAVIEADAAQIPVGIDGEALMVPTSVVDRAPYPED